MATYTARASFSSRPNFKLDIEVTTSGSVATMRAYAVRTGSETTTPFANAGGGATRGYSFTNANSPTSGSAEWVFDFRPAGSSSSSNPYSVDVWGSGITRTLTATSTITATASMSLLGSASVSVTVPVDTTPAPVISGTFSNGTVGVGYSSSISASNSPTSWSTSGSLPPGLSGSGSGSTFTISGTPTTAGTYSFNVSATNSGGTDTESFSITIVNPAPVISGDFGSGTTGVGYSSSISASNNPTSWSVGSGLPPGLSASASGSTLTVSGTPTAAGTYSFSVTASNDGGSDTQSKSISIVAPPNPSWDSTGAFTSGKVNQGYYQTRTASNATSITSATTTAPGLSASASGSSTLILQGTPTAAGTFSVSATANGASGTTPATLSTTVTIAPLVPPTWSDTSLSSDFRVGQSYATTSSGNNSVSATNATSFSVVSGSLPAGISGSTSGSTYTLTGTPTTRGSYSFTLRASNTDGNATPDQNFSGNVTHPPLWTDETLAAFSQGRSYSDLLSVSTSTAVTWSITSGTLPTGITATTSGTNTNIYTLSGTPTGSGAYSFTIQASNSDGTLTKTFSGNILLVPNWTDNILGSFVDNVEYSDSVIATNSPTYSVTAGTLPAGITLNSSTGLVSGTPTGGVGTAYSFTITATNTDGTVSQAFSGTIQPDLGGGIKLFDGTDWSNKEIYVYDGTTWVLGRLYVYSGTAWIKSVY
jgi:hypothetical protein